MEINGDTKIDYIWNELQIVIEAARESGDAAARASAERVAQWCRALSSIQDGKLHIGARQPTKYPGWVTLEIARGGFATGKAAAAVDFSEDERERLAALAPEAPSSREALFSALLSADGLAWLRGLLASRRYKIERPEDAALPVVAWLLKNGHADDAASIVNEISPYAPELRFMPKNTSEPLRRTYFVHRFSSNDTRERLLERRSNSKIETQREALRVWLPFMDSLVAHWLNLLDGKMEASELPEPSGAWKDGAETLLNEYAKLKDKYTLCKKYHGRKENLQILLSATRDLLENGPGLANCSRARCVVDCYVRAHSRPGEKRLSTLREEQARIVSAPGYDVIARSLARRLPESDEGLANAEDLLFPIPAEELKEIAPEGIFDAEASIPDLIRKIVQESLSAPLQELIKRKIVPSAKIMAELVPQMTAQEMGRAYDDEGLGFLMMETYKVFYRRRSLLLMKLSPQFIFDELPWVKAVRNERRNTKYSISAALHLAACALDFFPGVILPNPLVEQLNALYLFGSRRQPFVAELTADIVNSVHFSWTFTKAALAAAALLRGSLYERYYGLDYEKFGKRVAAAGISEEAHESESKTPFGLAVREHMKKSATSAWSSEDPCYSALQRGMLIESAQIYTTHNLATLVTEEVEPEHPYEELAFMAFEHSFRLIRRAREANVKKNRNELRLIKNAANAWRQALFFLSISPDETVGVSIRRAEESSVRLLGENIARKLFEGLKIAASGAQPGGKYRPFLGWTAGQHWLVS